MNQILLLLLLLLLLIHFLGEADIDMRLIPILFSSSALVSLLVVFDPCSEPAPCYDYPEDVPLIRLGHAVADAGPATVGRSPICHLCKNMQNAVKSTVSRLLVFIGIGGPSLAVIAPIPEGGLTRIQITTNSQASHKFAAFPVIETFAPVPVDHELVATTSPYCLYRTLCTSVKRTDSMAPYTAFTTRRRLDRGLGILSPFSSVWDWRPGVLAHMFRVLMVLLSRALRSGPVPIEAHFHSYETRRLVLDRMWINVAFLWLPSRDQLACLTVSITVRE